MQGYFISLEGIDGCGKTTLLSKLKTYFSSRGQALTTLREPGGTVVSEAIRRLLLDPAHKSMTPSAEALLYAAARAQVRQEIIQPSLERGDIVLADRYIDSTLAYQGYGRGLALPFLQNLNDLCTAGLKPDLTLLLDLDPEAAARRQSLREDKKDRLEQEGLSFQQKIRAGYLSIAREEPERIVCLSADPPADEVFARALQVIEERLSRRNAETREAGKP